MGTRSTVKFFSEFSEKPIASIYIHWDGYISGVGHDLANFLKDKKLINGISNETMEDGYANGIGCLAAQYIANHKKQIGGFYMVGDDAENESFNYEVRVKEGKIIIKVDDYFEGTPDELLNFKED